MADRVGGQLAVADQLVEGFVAGDRLVLPVGFDEGPEGVGRDAARTQHDVQPGYRRDLAGEAGGDAGEVGVEDIQHGEPVGWARGAVTGVVDQAGERIACAQRIPVAPGQHPQRHGKVLGFLGLGANERGQHRDRVGGAGDRSFPLGRRRPYAGAPSRAAGVTVVGVVVVAGVTGPPPAGIGVLGPAESGQRTTGPVDAGPGRAGRDTGVAHGRHRAVAAARPRVIGPTYRASRAASCSDGALGRPRAADTARPGRIPERDEGPD